MENPVLENLDEIEQGDIITLLDFNTLEANGGEYEGTISDASKWVLKANDFQHIMYGFRIEIDEDTTLMLVVRHIPSQDLYDYRLFRLWEEGIALESEFVTKQWELLENFSLDFGEDYEDVHDYTTKPASPCYDVKRSDGKQVLIGEYAVLGTQAINFFAKHAMIEWYGFVGENGENGLVSVWLGWDIGENDFSIIKR